MRSKVMSANKNDVPVVEFLEEGPREEWAKYQKSGMRELINSYNLVQALQALAATGLAEQLRKNTTVNPADLLENVNSFLGEQLLSYLAVQGVVAYENEVYSLTPKGMSLLDDVALAQLGFYREAYGPIVDKLGPLMLGEVDYGTDCVRDGESLGRHCATLFHIFHTPIVLSALEDIGAHSILDLGCGGGRFLIDACKQNKDLRGVGLDISAEAIEFARDLAEKEGVSERLSFVVGDAFKPDSWPAECRSVDALCAVGVVHEHFRDGEEAVIDILNVYADLLKDGVKSFILGEPELHYDLEENDPDLHLIHIFTKQGFPRRRELWLKLFPKTRLQCRKLFTRPNAGPRFAFYDLCLKGS